MEMEIEVDAVRSSGENVKTSHLKQGKFIYGVADSPPLHLTVFFGLQQTLLSLSLNLTVVVLIADAACARSDELLKAELLSTTLVISGISTILMVLIGSRLPIYQGPATAFVIPLTALRSLDDWKCHQLNLSENITMAENQTSESLSDEHTNEALYKIQLMQGTLMVVGVFQTLLGATGLIGKLLKFIGPITVVPVLFLIGISIYKTSVSFCQSHWGVAILTFAIAMILSLYLDNYTTPIPFWTKSKGFHFEHYPLHKVFSLLIAIAIGWLVSVILTNTGSLSNDPSSGQYYARTDARLSVIDDAKWIYIPYPGQFGPPRFSVDVFVTFFIATLISVIDSVGDYYACARICEIPAPPTHAVNRGIFVEGVMSFMAGTMGAGHATTSYGPNLGALGFTRVASLRVFIACGLFYILFGIVGKMGAFFITLPYSVLGGVTMVSFGMFIGFNFANLIPVEINSRNMSIIGISMLVGISMPSWVRTHPNAINTGIFDLDRILKSIIGNPTFAGGCVACFLDNTVPGTNKERGLDGWIQVSGSHSSGDVNDTIDYYGLPFFKEKIQKSTILRHIPFLPGYKSKTL